MKKKLFAVLLTLTMTAASLTGCGNSDNTTAANDAAKPAETGGEQTAAGSSIALIPMIIVYLMFNRFFIEGLTAGAVKG